MPARKETQNFTRTFTECGMEFFPGSSGNSKADCPFCGKENHFFLNPATGMWDCKHCAEKGNHYTFLNRYHEILLRSTTEEQWSKLSELRHGIPVEYFMGTDKGIPCAFDPLSENWLIPCYGQTSSQISTILNLHRWAGPGSKCLSSANCSLHLFREHALLEETDLTVPVFLCEGPWDAIALCWLQSLVDFKGVIVGVPGATTFKEQWAVLLKDRIAIFLYDNDTAGRIGSTQAARKTAPHAKSVRTLAWTKDFADKYDVNDFITNKLSKGSKPTKGNAKSAFMELAKMLVEVPKSVSSAPATITSSPITGQSDSVSRATEVLQAIPVLPQRTRKQVSYSSLIREWKKNYHLDKNMMDAFQVVLATALSVNLSGDPLWLFLVGPPGSGKTAMLVTLSASDLIQYESSLTPHNLVSGFKSNNGEDASLLPLWNRKCVVLKDYTEIISMPKQMQEEIYGTLRGAYDGSVAKRFGNGQHRCYSDLYFSLVAGVTDVIHGDERATLGERFLKFEFLRSKRTGHTCTEDQVRSAIRGLNRPLEIERRLRFMASDFIWGIEQRLQPPATLALPANVEPPESLLQKREAWFQKRIPKVPLWVEDRVIALSQIIAYLRAGVLRHRDGEISYRARPEVATRLAKQLAKLGKSLCLLHGESSITPSIYQLVERTAFDTAVAWNVDIVHELVSKSPKLLSIQDLMQELQIPRNTLQRRLDNLQELRAIIRERMPVLLDPVTKQKHPGQPPYGYRVTPQLCELWKRAKISLSKH